MKVQAFARSGTSMGEMFLDAHRTLFQTNVLQYILEDLDQMFPGRCQAIPAEANAIPDGELAVALGNTLHGNGENG